MTSIAVGTIVRANYLPFARVLAASLAEHHPELPVAVVVVDDPPDGSRLDDEPFRVVRPEELDVPQLRRWLFEYDAQELTVALKPYILRWLLGQGHDGAVFIDADILVLDRLDELLSDVAAHAIVLTPHLLAPLLGADRVARELNILQSGAHNGGVLGVSERPSAWAFLAWWKDRLRTHCRGDLAHGMHYDQRWLDLVPVLFEDVVLHRDAALNVAHWNLPERSLHCRLFHFSGFRPGQPSRITWYSSRLTTDDVVGADALFLHYLGLLRDAGSETCSRWQYRYDRFDNGTPITTAMRRAYADLGDAAAEFGDPFATRGRRSLHRWLRKRGIRST